MPALRPVPCAVALLLVAACDDPAPPAAPARAALCDVHASAPTHFVDATDAWGLGPSGLAATGNRITAADLDGDGYPDLVIHAISTNQRQAVGATDRLVSVLYNRPKPGGGRTFVDGTAESGVFQVRDGDGKSYRSAQLVVAGDVDNDGDLDLYSGTYVDPTKPSTDTGDRSEVLLNDGHGHFTLAPPSDARPGPDQLLPTTSAVFTDVDRDGKLDLFVGYWYDDYGASHLGTQAQLLRGLGNGAFRSITASAGLTTDDSGFEAGTNHRPAYGVTACDLDGDGAPELLVSAYGRQWNLAYRNDGAGHFTEVGRASGFAGDDLVDYKDNQFFACYCTVHKESPDCAGVGAPKIVCGKPADAFWQKGVDDRPWRLNGNTFTSYCGDLDGDGVLDVYQAAIRHWHIGQSSDPSELLHGASTPGTVRFTRPGNAATGLAWPHKTSDWNEGGLMAAGADLDRDGREDLVVGASDYPDNYGLVFHQTADHRFEEVGAAWGLHHACVSGLAVADFDRDGDLDVVVGSGTARDCGKTWKRPEVHFYENRAEAGRWLLVKLVGDGVTSNRTGLGARVTVTTTAADGTRTAIVKELDGGYGHMAMGNDTVLFFGLGGCEAVDSVSVRWPDRAATVETWPVVTTNRFLELRRGDRAVHEVKLAK